MANYMQPKQAYRSYAGKKSDFALCTVIVSSFKFIVIDVITMQTLLPLKLLVPEPTQLYTINKIRHNKTKSTMQGRRVV